MPLQVTKIDRLTIFEKLLQNMHFRRHISAKIRPKNLKLVHY